MSLEDFGAIAVFLIVVALAVWGIVWLVVPSEQDKAETLACIKAHGVQTYVTGLGKQCVKLVDTK